MRIKDTVIHRIENDNGIKALLCVELDKSIQTITRWIRENHYLLTTAAALKVIRNHYDLTDEEILEESANSVLR